MYEDNKLIFKSNKERILYFIDDFKSYNKNNVLEDTFTKGYCYYFALILKDRFDGSIYYDPKIGHFITKIGRDYYDITGCVTDKYKNNTLYSKDEWISIPSIINGCVLKHI